MYKVEVEIPAGDTCMRDNGKPCIMARFTKKWNAYNCTVYSKILKGGDIPRKCDECKRYCENYESQSGAEK